jgi:alkanesulfonate monooxygenase SsuD/methylene tetrahydromethanopterin reductase-like flavin-dependent oxidoreductase (luciferase family)
VAKPALESGGANGVAETGATSASALWHTCSSPPSFERAGQLGVGVLGTTLFAPVDALEGMIKGYRKAIAQLGKPAGRFINDAVGIFTFVHVAESTRAAIASGAPRSALWYVSSAPRVFNVPRDIFYTNIRGSTTRGRVRRRTRRSPPLKSPTRTRSTIRIRSSRC